jgi:nanoRNase/pAp phosphatase (c-di-AMP/oligoRNAs hydrolase)
MGKKNIYELLKPHLGPGHKAMILVRPDPDSLSSAWALALLFKKEGSSAVITIHESIKRIENRTMVKLLHIPVTLLKETDINSFNRWCIVDSQPNQFPDLPVPRWDIVIDHHPFVEGYSYRFSDIRSGIGATATIMTQYLNDAGGHVNEWMATSLCYGIITDTDHFQRNMTREDALAFSSLFPQVNYTALRMIEQTEISFRHLPFLNLALSRLKVKSRRVVISLGAVDMADIAVILADFFIRVSGIEFVAVAGIEKEKLVIIFRSRGLRRDVGKIASQRFSDLGSAGGHHSAARAELPLSQLPPEVKLYSPDSIEDFISKRLKRPKKSSTK